MGVPIEILTQDQIEYIANAGDFWDCRFGRAKQLAKLALKVKPLQEKLKAWKRYATAIAIQSDDCQGYRCNGLGSCKICDEVDSSSHILKALGES